MTERDLSNLPSDEEVKEWYNSLPPVPPEKQVEVEQQVHSLIDQAYGKRSFAIPEDEHANDSDSDPQQ